MASSTAPWITPVARRRSFTVGICPGAMVIGIRGGSTRKAFASATRTKLPALTGGEDGDRPAQSRPGEERIELSQGPGEVDRHRAHRLSQDPPDLRIAPPVEIVELHRQAIAFGKGSDQLFHSRAYLASSCNARRPWKAIRPDSREFRSGHEPGPGSRAQSELQAAIDEPRRVAAGRGAERAPHSSRSTAPPWRGCASSWLRGRDRRGKVEEWDADGFVNT